MKIAQLYADVTVIEELEAGAVPWLKCWKESSDGLLPAKAVTKRTLVCTENLNSDVVTIKSAKDRI